MKIQILRLPLMLLPVLSLWACGGADQKPPRTTFEVQALQDPLKELVQALAQDFSSAENFCKTQIQDEDFKRKAPEKIVMNKDVYRRLRSLRFHVDKGQKIISTGYNRPLFYYKAYDFSKVVSGCARNTSLQSLLPLSRESDAVVLFVKKESGEKETVYFFKTYFYTVKESLAVKFFGPQKNQEVQFKSRGLKVEDLQEEQVLNRATLQLGEAKKREVFSWLSEVLTLKLTDEEREKFFNDRPFYTTEKEIRLKGVLSFSQLPVVSVYSNRLGLLSSPKRPLRLRLQIESEKSYLQSRVAASMLESFSKRFRVSSDETSNLVFATAFLVLSPDFIYEILESGRYLNIRQIILNSGIIDRQKHDLVSKEQAGRVIEFLKIKTSEDLLVEVNLMKDRLKGYQDIEQAKINFARDILRAFSDVLANRIELHVKLYAMAATFSSAGVANGESLSETLITDNENLSAAGKKMIELYKESVQKIYTSKSYLNAYRFDHPIFQLDEKAFLN